MRPNFVASSGHFRKFHIANQTRSDRGPRQPDVQIVGNKATRERLSEAERRKRPVLGRSWPRSAIASENGQVADLGCSRTDRPSRVCPGTRQCKFAIIRTATERVNHLRAKEIRSRVTSNHPRLWGQSVPSPDQAICRRNARLGRRGKSLLAEAVAGLSIFASVSPSAACSPSCGERFLAEFLADYDLA